MPVASMTGFARAEGRAGDLAFAWELRAVNGKALDLRFRLAPPFDTVEPEARRLAGARLARGTVQVALILAKTAAPTPLFAVNEAMLAEILSLSDRLVAAGHAVTPTADGILAIRGLIEAPDAAGTGTDLVPEQRAALLEAFAAALDGLAASRREEGAAVARAVGERLATMDDLVRRAEADPARRPEAIARKLRAQVAALLDARPALDEARLHAEAVLMAARADVAEELDRLRAHLTAARALLDGDGPIGRRLDFLAQEFSREANTLCAKSNAASLTAIGLDLKLAVDQFREQVQNLE